jgi:hypothetical protein
MGTMHTSRPATWAALAFVEFFDRTLYAPGARFISFGMFHPANKFVTGEWGESVPINDSFFVSSQHFHQISWYFMYRSVGGFSYLHVIYYTPF